MADTFIHDYVVDVLMESAFTKGITVGEVADKILTLPIFLEIKKFMQENQFTIETWDGDYFDNSDDWSPELKEWVFS